MIIEQSTKQKRTKESTQMDSSDKLIERVEIKGSPFIAVKLETEWNIAIGKYIVIKGKVSFEECVKEVEEKSWMLITNLISVIAYGTINKE